MEAPAADPPADGGLDDLFGEPPAEEVPATDGDGLDDLFGAPTDEPSDTMPASTPEQPSAPTPTIDDLFGATADPEGVPEGSFEELPAPVNLVPKPSRTVQVVSSDTPAFPALGETRVRTWIDNTGQYRTQGRLIEIHDDSVRLLKTNGRVCTVPNSRLCQADAAYVDAVKQKLATPVRDVDRQLAGWIGANRSDHQPLTILPQ